MLMEAMYYVGVNAACVAAIGEADAWKRIFAQHYMGHNYIGHDYIDHYYIGHDCIGP